MEVKDRERITQAAFLIGQGKIEEADDVPGSMLTNNMQLPTDLNNGSVFYRLIY